MDFTTYSRKAAASAPEKLIKSMRGRSTDEGAEAVHPAKEEGRTLCAPAGLRHSAKDKVYRQ